MEANRSSQMTDSAAEALTARQQAVRWVQQWARISCWVSMGLGVNLIILAAEDCVGNDRYRVTDRRAQHIREVLCGEVGQVLAVGLIDGPQGTAEIESIEPGEVLLRCDWQEAPASAGLTVDVICALPRPQTLKKVLESVATMGVRRLHLVRANRVEKSYFQSAVLAEAEYRRHLLAGLSQGRRTRLPEVHVHKRFRPFFEDTLTELEGSEETTGGRLLCDEAAEGYLDRQAVAEKERVLLAVGPEGGWTDFETELMMGIGFVRFGLGPWTLRVENALVAALGQIELAIGLAQSER